MKVPILVAILVAIAAATLSACQPIVPDPLPPAATPTVGRTPAPAPTLTAEPAPTQAQAQEPMHSDPMWPDMRFTEPLKIEETEMMWAVAAAQADNADLAGTVFEEFVEDEGGALSVTLFYYMLLLQAQAFCFEDNLTLAASIEQHAARIGPRLLSEAEADVEEYSSPPLPRYLVLMLLLFSWEEPLGYICMDKACLAEVEATSHCDEWLNRNLDCLFAEDPDACFG